MLLLIVAPERRPVQQSHLRDPREKTRYRVVSCACERRYLGQRGRYLEFSCNRGAATALLASQTLHRRKGSKYDLPPSPSLVSLRICRRLCRRPVRKALTRQYVFEAQCWPPRTETVRRPVAQRLDGRTTPRFHGLSKLIAGSPTAPLCPAVAQLRRPWRERLTEPSALRKIALPGIGRRTHESYIGPTHSSRKL